MLGTLETQGGRTSAASADNMANLKVKVLYAEGLATSTVPTCGQWLGKKLTGLKGVEPPQEDRWSVQLQLHGAGTAPHSAETGRRGNLDKDPVWNEVLDFKTPVGDAKISVTLLEHREGPDTAAPLTSLTLSPTTSQHSSVLSPTSRVAGTSADLVFRSPRSVDAAEAGAGAGAGSITLGGAASSTETGMAEAAIKLTDVGRATTRDVQLNVNGIGSCEKSITLKLQVAMFVSVADGMENQMARLAQETPYEKQCRLSSTLAYSHLESFAWSDQAFVSQFGDVFGIRHLDDGKRDSETYTASFLAACKSILPHLITDTDAVEQSSAVSSAEEVAPDLRDWLGEFKQVGESEAKLGKVLQSVAKARTLSAELAKSHGDHKAMASFIQARAKEVYDLVEASRHDKAACLLWPGGWVVKNGDRTTHRRVYHIVFVFEKHFAFVTCNAGVGVNYHRAAPMTDKDKRYTSLRIDCIPPSRLADRAFLWALFHYQVQPTEADGKILYELLLPHLAKGCLATTVEDVEYRKAATVPRSEGRSQPYRNLFCAVSYMMRLQGLSVPQVKNLSFVLRLAFLRRARADLERLEASDRTQNPDAGDKRGADAPDAGNKQEKEDVVGTRVLPDGVFEADRRMIELACHQVALCAVKESKAKRISVDQLKALRQELQQVKDMTRRARPAMPGWLPPPSASPSSEGTPPGWCAWPGLEMARLSAGQTLERWFGEVAPAKHRAPVDLLRLPAPAASKVGPEEVVEVLKALQLVTTATRSEDRESMLQVATEVEHAFIAVLPPPSFHAADCAWRSRSAAQRDQLLSLLAWSSKEYTAATRSVPFHLEMQTPRLLTHVAIMAACFQVVRTVVDDMLPAQRVLPLLIAERKLAFDPDLPTEEKLQEVLRRSVLVEPEQAEARSKLLAFVEDMQAWSRQDGGEPQLVFGMRFSLKRWTDKERPDGAETRPMTGDEVEASPVLGVMRELLLREAEPDGLAWEEETGGDDAVAKCDDGESLASDGPAGGSVGGIAREPTTKRKKVIGISPNLRQQLEKEKERQDKQRQEKTAKGETISEEIRIQKPTELQKLVHWFVHTPSKGSSDWRLLRDMLFRYWMGLQCSPPNYRAVKSDTAFLSADNAEVSWSAQSGNDFKTSGSLKAKLGCSGAIHNLKYGYSRADARLYLGKMFLGANKPQAEASEGHVVHAATLQTPAFWKAVVEEDVEELLSVLTAPYVRIPLLLHFFHAERASLLQHPAVLALFTDAIFEAGHWAPATSFPTPEELFPVRQPLGTPRGMLTAELERAPAGVIEPLTALLRKLSGLCSGSSRSRFVEALLGVVRVAVRVRHFARAVLARGTPPAAQGQSLAELETELEAVLIGEQTPVGEVTSASREGRRAGSSSLAVIERWIRLEGEEVGEQRDTLLLCALHAHRAMVIRPDDAQSALGTARMASLLQSATFVKLRFLAPLTGGIAHELRGLCEQAPFWLLRGVRHLVDAWLRSAARADVEEVLTAVLHVMKEDGSRRWAVAVRDCDDANKWVPAMNMAADSKPFQGEQSVVECVTVLGGQGGPEEFHFDVHACELWQTKTKDAPIPDSFSKLATFRDHCADLTQFCKHSETKTCETVEIELREGGRRVSMVYQLWKEIPKHMFHDSQGNPEKVDPRDDAKGWRFAGKEYGGKLSGQSCVREYAVGRHNEASADVPGWVRDVLDPVLKGALMEARTDRRFSFQVPKKLEFSYLLPRAPIDENDAEVSLLFRQHIDDFNCWKLLLVCRTFNSVQAFSVDSFGRRGFLKQVYTSDVRFAMAAMRQDGGPKSGFYPSPSAVKHQAGNLKMEPHGGNDLLVTKAVLDEQGAVIDKLLFVPSHLLAGQLPAALLNNFDFWQHTGVHRSPMRGRFDGTHRGNDPFFRYALEVRALTDVPGDITVLRLDQSAEATGGAHRRLVNLHRVPIGSAYHDLFLLLARLEDISHILAWTEPLTDAEFDAPRSEARVGSPPAISLLELPRLKLRFQVRVVGTGGCSRDGTLSLESLDRVGMAVTRGHRELPASLVAGLPAALLLADSAGSLAIMLPNCPRARRDADVSPMGTESVPLPEEQAWLRGCAEMRVFVYDVHVCKRFVSFPSLGSVLYWTYCKLLHREYAAAFHAAQSCGTDMPLSQPERTILHFFKGSDLADASPDAHACRLRLRIALAYCPDVGTKVDLDAIFGHVSTDIRQYVVKSAHVSSACRLSIEEETSLLQRASHHCLANRKKLLDAVQQIDRADPTTHEKTLHGCSTLSTTNSSNFWNNAVDSALHNIPAWSVTVKWAIAKPVSLQAVASCAAQTDKSAEYDFNYLWMSLLLAGHSTIEEGLEPLEGDSRDNWAPNLAHAFGAMAVKLRVLTMTKYGAERIPESAPWFLLVRSCALSVKALQDLPVITEKGSSTWVYTYEPSRKPNEKEKFDDRYMKFVAKHRELVQGVQDAVAASKWASGASDDKVQGDIVVSVEPRLFHPPTVADCKMARRELKPFSHLHVSMTPSDVTAFATRPLDGVTTFALQSFLRTRPAPATQTAGEFPFKQTSKHRLARNREAARNLERLEDAWRSFDKSLREGRENSIAGITPELLRMADDGAHDDSAEPDQPGDRAVVDDLQEDVQRLFHKVSRRKLGELLAHLRAAAADDAAKLRVEIEATEHAASVAPADDIDPEEQRQKIHFALRQLCGVEPRASLQQLIATMMSTEEEADMKQLNPFLTGAEGELMDSVVGIVFRSIRVAQLRRAVDTALKAVKAVGQTVSPEELASETEQARKQRLKEYVSIVRKETANLSAELGSERHIVGPKQRVDQLKQRYLSVGLRSDRGQVAHDNGEPFEFDPRFLLFEFLFGWLLSSKQVELVQKFVAKASPSRPQAASPPHPTSPQQPPAGPESTAQSLEWNQEQEWSKGSMVHQMIMGAGKTTCIGPLLCLILADREALVTEVVPTALLAMSRNVLWTRFTHIVPKRIFTFEFSRSTRADPASVKQIYHKLDAARRHGDIVVTTPAAIKSFVNRFVEIEKQCRMISEADDDDDFGKEFEEARKLEAQQKADAPAVLVTLASVLDLWSQRRQGVLILDEVDMLLHPLRSELNFPVGKNPKQINPHPERWSFPMFVFEGLFWAVEAGNDPGEDVLHWQGHSYPVPKCLRDLRAAIAEGYANQALQRKPHLVLLDEQWYQQAMLPSLAMWAFEWMKSFARLFGSSASVMTSQTANKSPSASREVDTSVVNALTEPLPGSSPEIDLPAVVHFLIRGRNCDRKVIGMLGPELKEALGESYERLMQLLNLGHELLTAYLPHALSKVNRVSFGLLNDEDLKVIGADQPRSRLLLAVPFMGKDTPSQAAEFAQPDVLIAMTILAYRYNGMRKENLGQVIERYKKTVSVEVGNRVEAKWTFMLFKQAVFQQVCARLRQSHQRLQDSTNPMPPPPTFRFSEDVETIQELEKTCVRLWQQTGSEPRHLGLLSNLELISTTDTKDMDGLFSLLRASGSVISDFLHDAFADTMRLHRNKISSSAQELGSGIIFGRRLGFSGTPSSLLPRGLGECQFDRESEGKILHTLTTPEIVNESPLSVALRQAGEAWSSEAILDSIAREAVNGDSPTKYHALIDTGALITGLSNEEVARYLLDGRSEGQTYTQGKRMEGFDAVVFLDERDQRMVIKRGATAAFPLSEYGGTVDRMFTFFDQVHTTGMDIKQALDARALLTIGKDMTFRDYAQGGYRMRGIGKGQTLHLFVVPEMWTLFDKVLEGTTPSKPATSLRTVRRVVEWLLLNGLKTERMQFQQLQTQNLTTIWRSRALDRLLLERRVQHVQNESEVRKWSAEASLACWVDTVNVDLPESIGQQDGFASGLAALNRTYANKFLPPCSCQSNPCSCVSRLTPNTSQDAASQLLGLVMTADQLQRFDAIVDLFKAISPSDGSGEGATKLGSEMTREKEREQTQLNEEEKPPEDTNSAPKLPPPSPWGIPDLELFAQSALHPAGNADPSSDSGGSVSVGCFVSFALLAAKSIRGEPPRLPFTFPPTIVQTVNFAPAKGNKNSSLKSVLLVMDWVPDIAKPEERTFVALSLAEAEAARALIDACNQGQGTLGQSAMGLVVLHGNKTLACTTNYWAGSTRGGLMGPGLVSCLELMSESIPLEQKKELFDDSEIMRSKADESELGVLRVCGTAGACLKFINNEMSLSEVESMLFLDSTMPTPSGQLSESAREEVGAARLHFFREVLERRRKCKHEGMIGHSSVRWLFKPAYQPRGALAGVIKLKRTVVKKLLALLDPREGLPGEFDKADGMSHSDGEISPKELQGYLNTRLGLSLDDQQLGGIVGYLDTNNDGVIDKHEFIKMFTL